MEILAPTIVVRPASAADVPALCRLAVELVGQHVAYDPARYQPPADVAASYAELFAEHIDRPGSVVLVAEAAGEPVGYVFGAVEPPSLVAITGRTGWIHDLYVSPTAKGRRRGASAGRGGDGAPQGRLPGRRAAGSGRAERSGGKAVPGRGFRPTLQEMALGPADGESGGDEQSVRFDASS